MATVVMQPPSSNHQHGGFYMQRQGYGRGNVNATGPSDMAQLKMAILSSSVPGQAFATLMSSNFQIRHAGYTSLIQLAAKSRQPQTAVEIFEAMKSCGVEPNTFTYSALISALGKCNQWELATNYFEELQAKAEADPDLAPNTVTYAAVISAHEKRGCKEGLARAIELFEEQCNLGVPADVITYSSLVAACERAGEVKKALDILYRMHCDGITASIQLYNRLIASCGTDWSTALDVFLSMQCAEVEISPATADLLFNVLLSGKQHHHALWLLKESVQSGWLLSPSSYSSLLRLLTGNKLWKELDTVLAHMQACGVHPDGYSVATMVEAFKSMTSEELWPRLNNILQFIGSSGSGVNGVNGATTTSSIRFITPTPPRSISTVSASNGASSLGTPRSPSPVGSPANSTSYDSANESPKTTTSTMSEIMSPRTSGGGFGILEVAAESGDTIKGRISEESIKSEVEVSVVVTDDANHAE